MEQPIEPLERDKVNLETAKIPWRELQRFFAGGAAVFVAPELDLVEVAWQFAADNKPLVQHWLQQNQVHLVSDLQALNWFEGDTEVWAVVVKPWVLVQESH